MEDSSRAARRKARASTSSAGREETEEAVQVQGPDDDDGQLRDHSVRLMSSRVHVHVILDPPVAASAASVFYELCLSLRATFPRSVSDSSMSLSEASSWVFFLFSWGREREREPSYPLGSVSLSPYLLDHQTLTLSDCQA